IRAGQEPGRIRPAAIEYHGAAGARARWRHHRSRQHVADQDRPHRQWREERAEGQGHRCGAARRHHHRRRKVLLMMDPFHGSPDRKRIETPMPDAGMPGGPESDRAHGTGSTAYPSSNGYGGTILGDTEVHLSAYVKVLSKRRWTAATPFLLVVVGVSVYTFTATPVYEARAQILIEKENANVVSFKEAFEQNQIADDYYQTQYKILQSRTLARRTIRMLRLWDQPQFSSKPTES